MKAYPDEFWEQGSHGQALRLLSEAELPTGVVLDLGCAAGPLAEKVTGLGFDYVGADVDEAALQELTARGFEGHVLDLGGPEDEVVAAIEACLGGRVPVAVLALDVLEHLVDPARALRALARLAAAHEGLQLVVSIPNVTHLDVAIKLLLGRWDLTTIGLLDDTHVRFFNNLLVGQTLAGAGWVEVAANDVSAALSDQLFPADAPALRPGAPLRELLRRVRLAAEPHGETYQFVRRYRYDPETAQQAVAGLGHADEDRADLSVVVRAGASLDRLLADIARQDGDVEVLVCRDPDAERETVDVPAELVSWTRFVTVAPGSDFANAALAEAGGRYLAFLDSRSRLSADYLTTLRQLIEAAPGRVVQVGVAEASEPETDDVGEVLDGLPRVALDPLDLVTSVAFGAVSLDAYAIPRQACAANGLRFDPSAGDACPTMLLLEAVELCGIVRTGEQVVVVHPAVVRRLDSQIEVLQKHLSLTSRVVPEGAAAQLLVLREAVAERDVLARELAATRDQITTLSNHLRRMEPELVRLQNAESRRLSRRLRSKAGAVKRRLAARGLIGPKP